MEENNISIENIKDEIEKLKLEIIEKEKKIVELSNIINCVNEEEIEDDEIEK